MASPCQPLYRGPHGCTSGFCRAWQLTRPARQPTINRGPNLNPWRRDPFMSKLTGKTALITGGGSGIGLESARLLLAEGAHVAITGRDGGKLQRAAQNLGGERVYCHAADVGNTDQVLALVEETTKRL